MFGGFCRRGIVVLGIIESERDLSHDDDDDDRSQKIDRVKVTIQTG